MPRPKSAGVHTGLAPSFSLVQGGLRMCPRVLLKVMVSWGGKQLSLPGSLFVYTSQIPSSREGQ